MIHGTYLAPDCSDEMFDRSGRPRPTSVRFVERLNSLTQGELQRRQKAADLHMYNAGITFAVYGHEAGTEKVWPFDLVHPPQKVFETDGCPSQGMEVRTVDEGGKVLPHNEEGRLQARGPGTFVGYLKRPHLYAVDRDGWFETGDLARKDEDGYIRITGRTKDIIIRGGDNVPVIEIEQLMYRHPAVQEVAIVGVPDERLGERACACVVLREGASLTLTDVSGYMAKNTVAKNYWPEHIEVLDALPKTPSGKVQKFKLREMVNAPK